jgi:hypothetical protein
MLPLLIIGSLLLTFASSITNFALKREPPGSILHIKIFRNIFCLWMIRSIGVACIVTSFQIAKDNPTGSIMNKNKNIITLLENGEIVQATVIKSWYGEWAPAGWRIFYQFAAQNTETGDKNTYWGRTYGPKKYYADLSPGDSIFVIYYPTKPQINSEIKTFLNHPSHRHVFKEA